MKMYSASFKCNKTGKQKKQNFIGTDEQEVNKVIANYCKDENVTIMSNMELVDDNFDFNPVEINTDLTLVSDDVEADIDEYLDDLAEDFMNSESAND